MDEDKKPSSSPVITILFGINLLLVLGTLAFFVYSKLMFKRGKITDESERERLSAQYTTTTESSESVFIPWKPITVNIQASPARPRAAEGTQAQIEGKLHYVSAELSLEVRGKESAKLIEELTPVLTDKVIYLFGQKAFHELNSVQGRYLLSSQILDIANQTALLRYPGASKEGPVKSVYFTQFIVQ